MKESTIELLKAGSTSNIYESNTDSVESKLQWIVDKHQHSKIKFSDGLVDVDVQTASLLIKLLNVVKPVTRKKMLDKLNNGDKQFFKRFVDTAWKLTK